MYFMCFVIYLSKYLSPNLCFGPHVDMSNELLPVCRCKVHPKVFVWMKYVNNQILWVNVNKHFILMCLHTGIAHLASNGHLQQKFAI